MGPGAGAGWADWRTGGDLENKGPAFKEELAVLAPSAMLRMVPLPCACRGGFENQLPAAASTMGTNCAAVRLAPPTSAPSTSGKANSSAALSALTEPP